MVTSARHPDLRRGTGSGPDSARVGMPVAGVIAVLLVVLTGGCSVGKSSERRTLEVVPTSSGAGSDASAATSGTVPGPAPTVASGSAASGVARPSGGASAGPAYAPEGPVMDADRFWGLLAGLPATTEWKLAKLEGRLTGLNDSDRRAFGRRFITESTALLTWRHIQAAEVIMGSVSEDVFVDFRSWVVLQGPEVSRAFLTDPDSLAAVGPTDEEEIGMAQVFEALATELLGDEVAALYAEPLGDSPKDTYEVLAQRYPRLAAAYLPSPAPTGTPWDSGPRPIRRRS